MKSLLHCSCQHNLMSYYFSLKRCFSLLHRILSTQKGQHIRFWSGAIVVLLLTGCSTTNPKFSTMPDEVKTSITDLLPPRDSRNAVDKQIQIGIEFLFENQFKKASQAFSGALRYDPQNSYVQFLNGLSYHLLAEAGDSTQYELAKIGYGLALKFNKNNWLAARQLARLYLKTKKYTLAQENFAYALLYQPDNAQMLYDLAQASYYAQDIETAVGSIKRARELSGNDPDILAASTMISAASGQFESAKGQLALYKEIEPNKVRIERIAERVNDWLKVHEEKVTVAAADTPVIQKEKQQNSEVPSAENLKPAVNGDGKTPRMVIVDVVMIRTEESESTSKGVNLLDGLTLQFSDVFLSFKDTRVSDLISSSTKQKERISSSKLSIADLKYNMNIFNIGEDRTEVLARPTLVALEGQKSTFFSGSQLAVAILGNDVSHLEKIDVGVKLDITPTFVTDDSVLIAVSVGRTFVEPGGAGTFKESVRVSKNEVNATVSLKFGQTLILSGLREKQTSEEKSGVPILRDLPIFQYMFSTEKTADYHKSIVTIITPRRVIPGVYVSSASFESGEVGREEAGKQPYLEELRKSSTTLLSVDANINHIMRHLGKHRAVREFRETDLFDEIWYGSVGDMGSILKKTITFMYY